MANRSKYLLVFGNEYNFTLITEKDGERNLCGFSLKKDSMFITPDKHVVYASIDGRAIVVNESDHVSLRELSFLLSLVRDRLHMETDIIRFAPFRTQRYLYGAPEGMRAEFFRKPWGFSVEKAVDGASFISVTRLDDNSRHVGFRERVAWAILTGGIMTAESGCLSLRQLKLIMNHAVNIMGLGGAVEIRFVPRELGRAPRGRVD